ncbi:MAG TPA: hypothetical protein VLX92_15705 [Kofleriaceae bacterium]|nr:hypothetical protein [Kofleriaceae bacterium]
MRLALLVAVAGCSAHAADHAPDAGGPDAPAACRPGMPSDLPVPPVGALQMNDISVLLPLATTAQDFAAYPSAGSPGANGPLLPAELTGTLDSLVLPYDQLRVVALRLDPCFGNVGPITETSSCDNQLRLVFEPLVFGNGVTTAADGAVHVSYALTRAELVTAANAIAAAREVTTTDDLGPLAVHPIVAAQGLTGAMAHQLFAIIAQYADATRIERITSLDVPPSLGLGGNPTVFWQLQGVSVAACIETPLAIPTLSGATESGVNASTDPLETLVTVETASPDKIDVLASVDKAMAASPSARQDAYDAALRIENPNEQSPTTIDCASCHLAEPARRLVGEPLFSLSSAGDPNAFTSSTVPAADLVTTTPLVGADTVLDIHAFSYRGTSAMIDQRVVNETAANLAYLRTLP